MEAFAELDAAHTTVGRKCRSKYDSDYYDVWVTNGRTMGAVVLAILGWSLVIGYGIGSWKYNKWLKTVYFAEIGDEPNRSRPIMEELVSAISVPSMADRLDNGLTATGTAGITFPLRALGLPC